MNSEFIVGFDIGWVISNWNGKRTAAYYTPTNPYGFTTTFSLRDLQNLLREPYLYFIARNMKEVRRYTQDELRIHCQIK